jgi:hypothetical protein
LGCAEPHSYPESIAFSVTESYTFAITLAFREPIPDRVSFSFALCKPDAS